MFLRTIRARGHRYLVLVENYRDGTKVRQRVIQWFGREDELEWAKVREELAQHPGYSYFAVRKT